MKYQLVHALQKYLFNPPLKFVLAVSLAVPGYAVLETIGRKSGKPRRAPVGDGRVDKQFWLVAEHGMNAGYIRNITSNPRVRLKLNHGPRSRWHAGTAHLLPDDDPAERQRWLVKHLPRPAGRRGRYGS
jgi:deazaflavin-dependent oxidoreductase (nitroreductase family)